MAGLEIVDGTGRGYSARVSDRNHLVTEAIIETDLKRLTHRLGQVWSIDIPGITAVSSNDVFFYLENTGEKDLNLVELSISSSAATQVKLLYVSGTPSYTASNDAEVTPRNLGSTKVPVATIKTDTDTTGLTTEGVLVYMDLPVINTKYTFADRCGIIIPQGKAIALMRTTASGAITGTIILAQENNLSSDPF